MQIDLPFILLVDWLSDISETNYIDKFIYKFEETFKPVSFIILEKITGVVCVQDPIAFVNKMVKTDTLK